MSALFVKASAIALLGLSSVLGFFGYHVVSNDVLNDLSKPLVGATIPITTAFYSDSLQAQITPTATSFTLVKGTDSQGVALNGPYAFVIDQGSSVQEIVSCSTVSGINASGCIRGVNLTTGTSSVAALEQQHNRGASVQITTAPIVNILANIMRGVESIPAALFYQAHPCSGSSASTTICDKNYIDSSVTAGGVPGSTTVGGLVMTATGLQAASSTATGVANAVTYFRVLPASIATDTPNTGTNTSDVLMSDLTGHLKQGWLDLTLPFTFTGAVTHTGTVTNNATTTIAASSVTNNALVLDTLPYKFPSARSASSTVLSEDGNGNLSFEPSHAVYSAFNIVGATATNGYATTSLITIPAGVMTASSTIEITGYAVCQRNANSGGSCLIYLRDATGAKFLSWAFSSKSTANGTDAQGMFTINILPNGSASAQETIGDATVVGLDLTGAGSTAQLVGILGANDSTSAINLAAGFTLNGVVQAQDSNETAKIQEVVVRINQ